MSKPKLPAAIVEVAQEEIGVREIGNSNKGPRVDEYKAATSLSPHDGWAWCAAFVCFVVREAASRAGAKFTPTFQRPTTPRAWGFELWSLAQDNSTWTRKPAGKDIEPGDIVVFNKSHIGIAVSKPDTDGHLWTIEGNTNEAGSREGVAVMKKRRHVSAFRSRIRFMV